MSNVVLPYVFSPFTLISSAQMNADLGTLLAAVNGIYAASGATPVTDFGAKIDGVTDDWQAWTNAVTYLRGLGGGTITMPQGVSVISNNLVVPSNVRLQGAGEGVSFLSARAGFPANINLVHCGIPSGTPIGSTYINYSSATPGNNIKIFDMTLLCTNMPASGVGGVGAMMGSVNEYLLHNVAIQDAQGYGVYSGGDNSNINAMTRPMVVRCKFTNNGRLAGGDSLGGGGHRGSIYAWNEFTQCNGTAIDNVAVDSPLWMGNISHDNAVNKGGIFSDFGMSRAKIIGNELENGTLHLWGYLGVGLVGAPYDILVAFNTVKAIGSIGSLYDIGPGNQVAGDTRQVYGLRMIGNSAVNSADYAFLINDSIGALLQGNSVLEWDGGNGGNAAFLLSGSASTVARTRNCKVANNSVYSSVGKTQWLAENGATVWGNDVYDNTVPAGATYTLTNPGAANAMTRYRRNIGSAGLATFTAPTLPASGGSFTNNSPYDLIATLVGGANTAISVNGQGIDGTLAILAPGDVCTVSYTAAPTLKVAAYNAH